MSDLAMGFLVATMIGMIMVKRALVSSAQGVMVRAVERQFHPRLRHH